MKIISTLFAGLMLFTGVSVEAGGLNAFSVDMGKTNYTSNDDITVLRLGVQRNFNGWLESRGIPLLGYVETSLNYWKGLDDDIYGIGFSPVFVFPFCNACKSMPYMEAGVGLSLISDSIIDDRDMSSLFQFEGRIGVGMKTEDINVHIRYMHYSNGGMVLPNDGMDIFLAGLSFEL